jgi:hypothetical protein
MAPHVAVSAVLISSVALDPGPMRRSIEVDDVTPLAVFGTTTRAFVTRYSE